MMVLYQNIDIVITFQIILENNCWLHFA